MLKMWFSLVVYIYSIAESIFICLFVREIIPLRSHTNI